MLDQISNVFISEHFQQDSLVHELVMKAVAGSFAGRAATAQTFASSVKVAEGRPPKRDLVDLTLLYLAVFAVLQIVPLFSLFVLSYIPGLQFFSLEAVLLFYPAIFSSLVLSLPLIFQVLYLIFGADFFLLAWLDEAVVWGIERLVSNGMLLTEAFNFLISATLFLAVLFYEPLGIGFYLVTGLLMNYSFVYIWQMIMFTSVSAIRYVDPSWNKVSEGNQLYPGIAYRIGRKEYDNGADQSANQEQSEDMAIDETFTLLMTAI